MNRLLLTLLGFCLLILSCHPSKKITVAPLPAATTVSNDAPLPQPQVEKEFRAAWVATVANINWPSKPGLSTEEQKREALDLLNFLEQHHFNAVILQVRPQADALYASALEPWSYYLTGAQGKAPDPYYDPLQFWTEEAHERGIELHVWLNPYRAHHPTGGPVSDSSLVKRRPELVVYLEEGYWWFDPAKKGTQDHSSEVVMDLVRRYDIDGVHFDDYFYPYPSYNKGKDFPDSASYVAYQQSGGTLSRGDWRRESVNIFIERLYRQIKSEKPYVKFGLSPFGIWRPGHPSSIEASFDQYDQLYADAKLWLNRGWIDYFSPQLYWPITGRLSFPSLLGWWAAENKMARHLWPGMSVGRDTSVRTVMETMNQIMITRGMLPASNGAIHWSISSVTKNPAMAKGLIEGPYRRDALVPASPWLDNTAPQMPSANVTNRSDSVLVSWNHPDAKDVFRWIVYYQYGSRWDYKVVARRGRSLPVKTFITGANGQQTRLAKIMVSAVDRVGNESQRVVIEMK